MKFILEKYNLANKNKKVFNSFSLQLPRGMISVRLIKWTLSLFGFAYAAVVVVYVAENANNQGVFDNPKRIVGKFCDGLEEIARSLGAGGYAS